MQPGLFGVGQDSAHEEIGVEGGGSLLEFLTRHTVAF
jgi:hypothetical protein